MIKCTKFRSFQKGNLQGFASLLIEKWNLQINDCTLCMKDGKRWVNLPSKEYEKDGEKRYQPILVFKDPALKERFSESAKKAIDEFCKDGNGL